MYVCAHTHVPLRELAFEISQSFLACLGLSFWYTQVPSRLSLSQGALVWQQGFFKLEMTLMINLFFHPIILRGKLRKQKGKNYRSPGIILQVCLFWKKTKESTRLPEPAGPCLDVRQGKELLSTSVFESQSATSSLHHPPRDGKENPN